MIRGRAAFELPAAALALLLALVWWTGGRPAPHRTLAHRAPATWVWPTPDENGRMVLGPLVTYEAPDDVHIAVSSVQAMATLLRADLGPPDGIALDEIRLGLRLLGSPTGRPAWVVEYARDPMLLGGPPGLSTEARRQIIASGLCERVVVVDADSGELVTTVQACWPRGARLVGGYGG